MTFDVNIHHKFPEPSADCMEVRLMTRLARIEKLLHSIIRGDQAELEELRKDLKASTDDLSAAVKANS